MTVAFDPTGDWIAPDGVEAVTLKSRTSGDTFSSFSIAVALRWDESAQQFSAQSIAAVNTVRWTLWGSQLTLASAPAPQEGDVITDAAAISYTVLSVVHERVTDTYDVTTQQQT